MQRRMSPIERFMSKVMKTDSCWLWQGAISSTGYGSFGDYTSHGTQAHRFSYKTFKGPIPEGYEIDHLCRVRACVNPDHLELVTRRENLLRGLGPTVTRMRHQSRTHCKHGHPFDASNTAYDYKGARRCIECGRVRSRIGMRKRAAIRKALKRAEAGL